MIIYYESKFQDTKKIKLDKILTQCQRRVNQQPSIHISLQKQEKKQKTSICQTTNPYIFEGRWFHDYCLLPIMLLQFFF
jgi:hypothetical protein